jgi:ribonuclease HII
VESVHEEIDLLQIYTYWKYRKGDSKYLSIAAASVLAKTYRDVYMNATLEEYPMQLEKK